jgi:hypothetical protein
MKVKVEALFVTKDGGERDVIYEVEADSSKAAMQKALTRIGDKRNQLIMLQICSDDVPADHSI